jgi:hypothetical protein
MASVFFIPIFAIYVSQPFGIFDLISLYSLSDIVPLTFEFLDAIPLVTINLLSAILIFQFAYASYGQTIFDELRISETYRSSVRIIRPWEDDPPRSSPIVNGFHLAILCWGLLPWFLLLIFFDSDKSSSFSDSRYFDETDYAPFMIWSCVVIAISHAITLWSLLRSLKNEAKQWLIAVPALREDNRNRWVQETQRVLRLASASLTELDKGVKGNDD